MRALLAGLLAVMLAASAQAQPHGFTLGEKLALPPGFPHFPYANPDAPKGGEVSMGALGSFDSFNPHVLRGVAAGEILRIYDPLLRDSADESSTAYGLLALGQIDVILESTMKIWDWAALVPVIEGAGGRVVDWHGSALTPDSDGHVLAVGDPALLGQALPHLTA